MDCTRASDLMMSYFDGVIKDNEKIELLKHINECRACAEEYSILQEVVFSLEELEDFTVPDTFENEILNAIDLNRFAVTRRRTPKALTALGALLALSFFSSLIYFKYGTVNMTPVFMFLSSLTQLINVTTIISRGLTAFSSVIMGWIDFLHNSSLYFKGMVGIYFVILLILSCFFIGIHLTLIRLTTGKDVKGGSFIEE